MIAPAGRGAARGLAVVLAVTALAVSPPARADMGEACGAALLEMLPDLPSPDAERPLAVALLFDADFATDGGTLLSEAPPVARFGAELRLALGLPGTGLELVASGGWLVPALGSGGVVRGGLGVDLGWDLGGASLYLLLTTGALATGDGLPTPGALAVLPEWRFAMGLRLPAAGGAVVVEADTSALGWLGGARGPLLGLRLGYAFGGARGPGSRGR